MKISVDEQEMIYLEELENREPDLVHLGIARLKQARAPLAPHTHPGALELVYVESGMLCYYVGKEKFMVRGGQVFVSFPDEVHSTGSLPNERSTFGWLAVRLNGHTRSFLGHRSTAALALREQLRQLPHRVFYGSPELMNALERAVLACRSEQKYADLILHGAVIDLLTGLVENARTDCQAAPSASIQAARQLIETRLTERLTLDRLAEAAAMPLPTFKRRFKEQTGMPPYEYLMRRKIGRAAELLRQKHCDITTIAYDLGFSSSQHFSSTFRRWMNLSPREYRRTRQPS